MLVIFGRAKVVWLANTVCLSVANQGLYLPSTGTLAADPIGSYNLIKCILLYTKTQSSQRVSGEVQGIHQPLILSMMCNRVTASTFKYKIFIAGGRVVQPKTRRCEAM